MNKFIKELRRREVFRTGGLYIGIAWILIEASSVLLPTFDVPDWVFKTIVIGAFVGFPVALILAWFYDVTDEGVLREDEKEGPAGSLIGGRLTDFIVIGVLAVALIISLYVNMIGGPGVEEEPAPVSVLIADFDNQTGDPLFDGSLEQALNIGLEGASFVTAFKRSSAEQLLETLRPGGKLDEEGARLVSIREGVKLVVAGTVKGGNDGYELSARMISPQDGAVIAESSVDAKDKIEVLTAVSSLADSIREELGDKSIDDADRPVGETFTAASLEAVKHYTAAQNLAVASKYEESLAYYEAAVIKPFKQSKTLKDPILYGQFLNAQKLANQYKNHLLPVAEIFDLDKLAKYYAMLELTQARHGMVWHNQRFYFNPVLCKLEPIAFDGFANYSKLKPGIKNNYAYLALNSGDTLQAHEYLVYNLFTDSVFTSRYVKYLQYFSDSNFVLETMNSITPEMLLYDSLIKLEFPFNGYDFSRYSEVAADIRSYLPKLENMISEKQSDPNFTLYSRQPYFTDSAVFEDTPKFFVNAYLEKTNNDRAVVSIHNYYPGDIIILGTGNKRNNINNFQHPERKLKGYCGDSLRTTSIISDTGAVYLFFMTPNGFDSYVSEIFPWPSPKGNTPQQELSKNSKLENYFSFIRIQGKKLVIPPGNHTIDIPVIIPEGYTLQFEPGARIDLIDSAMLISYSPVEMLGTEENKVVVTSSDFSAKGFTVLRANKRSKVDHAVFENLNTLDYKGWTLTGAVNFYESDVDISNTLFYRNQCEDALNTIRSDFKLEMSTFEHIYSDAFDSDFCTGLVTNCKFEKIGNDAIDFSGSQIQISDTEIIEAKDKGISGGENSYVMVENTNILRSNIGLASKDLSTVDVKNSSIVDCNYGIVILQKKPEYGSAKMTLINTQINNTKILQLIEIGSEVIIDGKKIKGDKKDVATIFY